MYHPRFSWTSDLLNLIAQETIRHFKMKLNNYLSMYNVPT